MIRRASAIILALILNPAPLRAQETVLTVSVPSADVHQGPSVVTPIVGRVPRGTVLAVSRNLGSWVRVSWPDAQDGIGYVHVLMGRVAPPTARPVTNTNISPRSSSTTAPVTTTAPAAAAYQSSTAMPATMAAIPSAPPLPYTPPGEQATPIGRRSTVPNHVGLGGLVGSPSSFGATARIWRTKHVGIQFGFTRDAMTSDWAAGRVTSMQFEPGVLYSPFDRVSDYVWFRPYVGSVMSVRHQKLTVAPGVAPEAVDNSIGFRVFGGSEFRFASVPRFGVSVDVGYRRFPTAFAGFDADRVNASIAGHWYIK